MIAELVQQGHVVIAAEGGGTPVYRERGGFEGLDVVIDKDLAAYILAREIRASLLLILTDVDGVYTGYGTPSAQRIERLRDRSFGGVLDGHEAQSHGFLFDRSKDIANGHDGFEPRGSTELQGCCEVTERALGPHVRDGQFVFQRACRRDDLSKFGR